jgi:starvation-inducible DNA-binding protein
VLNGILADAIVLHDLYRRGCCLARDNNEGQLRQVLDMHALGQLELIDLLIERIQTLGGSAITTGRRVAERTAVRQPSDGVAGIAGMLAWLADVHALIIAELRSAAGPPGEDPGGSGTEHVLHDAIRRQEQQAWIIGKYLAEFRYTVLNLDPNGHAKRPRSAVRADGVRALRAGV